MRNPFAAPRFARSKSEKAIARLLFLFLLNMSATDAQYTVSADWTTSPPYQCTIITTDSTTWTDQDLVTWIFPDGQYVKKEIRLDGNGNPALETNRVEWKPSVPPVSNDSATGLVRTYVTKKGGTGPPPQIATPASPPVFANAYDSNNLPASFTFEPAYRWQLSPSWSIAKDIETFLIISYQTNADMGCSTATPGSWRSDFIELSFSPDQLDLEDKFGFHGEGIALIDDAPRRKILINNLNYTNPPGALYGLNSTAYKHVFLKVKTKLEPGDTINIVVRDSMCNVTGEPKLLSYAVEAYPHDPNKKEADIDTISASQTGQVTIRYTVQFHNDGNAPVKKVVVTDELPEELDPTTFVLVDTPFMNGLRLAYPSNTVNTGFNTPDPVKTIVFEGTEGLPGLGQANPAYSYNQTIYRFKFEIKTKPGVRETINNRAKVIFYHGNTELPHVITDVSKVYYATPDDPQSKGEPGTFCKCWKKFWRCFCKIFRREKKSPDPKPDTYR